MRAGRLNHFIAIERLEESRDPVTGLITEEWVLLAKVWAEVLDITGREYFAAGAIQSEATTKIRMRYRAGLTTKDRIIHEGRELNIVNIADPTGRRERLEILTTG